MINFSIKDDVVYQSTATTLEYYVTVDGDVVYQGRAKAGPNGLCINIRKIALDWMRNELRDFLPLQGEIVAHPEALRTFVLYDAETNTVLEQYRVLFDFADEWNGEQLQLNDPINGHADIRQKIFIGNSATSSGSTQDVDAEGEYERPDIEDETADWYLSLRGRKNDYFYVLDGPDDVLIDGQYVSPIEYRESISYGREEWEFGEWKHMPRKTLMESGVYGNVEKLTGTQWSEGLVQFRATDCGHQPTIGFLGSNKTYQSDENYIVYGNILSLEYGDAFRMKSRFNKPGHSLPRFGPGLKDARHLVIPLSVAEYNGTWTNGSGETLQMGCCSRMFSATPELVIPPTLYFRKIEAFGCSEMYAGCDLRTMNQFTPELTATEYESSACYRMYYGAGNRPQKIHARYLTHRDYGQGDAVEGAFEEFFAGGHGWVTPSEFVYPLTVEQKGAFYKMYANNTVLQRVEKTIKIGNVKDSRCTSTFEGMYSGCTGLAMFNKNVPFEMKNVSDRDFADAFRGASHVQNVTVKADSVSGQDCFKDWLYGRYENEGVINATQAVSDALPRNSESGVPTGWSVSLVQ